MRAGQYSRQDEPTRPSKGLDAQMCGLDHDSNTSVMEINEVEDENFQLDPKDVIHGGDEVERVGAQNESQFVKRMLDPRLPSKQEVEDHDLFHLPYRN